MSQNNLALNNIPKLRFPNFDGEWDNVQVRNALSRISKPVNVDAVTKYQQIGIRSHGRGIFYKYDVPGLELGKKRVFWVEPNTFIVNIVFAWEQAVAKTTLNEKGMIASHRFPMYVPLEGKLDLDFILNFFLTKRGKYLLGMASPGGAGRNKTLGQNNFEKLIISIPGIDEQEKIVSFLNTLENKSQILNSKIKYLKKYKSYVTQEIFTQKVRFKNNGKLPPDWVRNSLGNLGKTFNGLSGKNANDFGSGANYITYKQIFDNTISDESKFGLVRININEVQNKVKKGDIFFTTSSETPQELGYASVLLEDIKDVCLNSFCFGYRINNQKELLPEFAQFLFRTKSFRKKVERLAQGSTRYNLSKTQLMKLEVEFPNEKEQMIIARFLTDLDLKISQTENELNKFILFRKGILQQMFV